MSEVSLTSKPVRSLIKAILSLETEDEARCFFRDLLTSQEITEMAKRWQTAQLLEQNVSYTKIAKETGLSSTTIARISKWLKHGRGGYQLALKRIHHNESA